MATAAQLNYAERVVEYAETVLYGLESATEALKEVDCPKELSEHFDILKDIYHDVKKLYDESDALLVEEYRREEEELRRDSMFW